MYLVNLQQVILHVGSHKRRTYDRPLQFFAYEGNDLDSPQMFIKVLALNILDRHDLMCSDTLQLTLSERGASLDVSWPRTERIEHL